MLNLPITFQGLTLIYQHLHLGYEEIINHRCIFDHCLKNLRVNHGFLDMRLFHREYQQFWPGKKRPGRQRYAIWHAF